MELPSRSSDRTQFTASAGSTPLATARIASAVPVRPRLVVLISLRGSCGYLLLGRRRRLARLDSVVHVRRVSVLVIGSVLASCSTVGSSDGDEGLARQSSTLPSPVETLLDEEPATSAPPLEVPSSSVVDQAPFGPAVDPSTDPFFQRRLRPILATNPTDTWSMVVDRVTVPLVHDVGEVIVVHTVTPADDHALIGLDRADGSVVWEFEPGETIRTFATVGPTVLATLVDASGSRGALLDGATGMELVVPGDGGDVGSDGRFIRDRVNGTCSIRSFDPSTGQLVGEVCAVGAGPESLTVWDGESVFEVDPTHFQVRSDRVPLDGVGQQRRVMIVGDTVVTYGLSELNFLDRDGELLASFPDPGELVFRPAGVGSDVLIVYDFDMNNSVGYDTRTATPVWERPGDVLPFGVVDGEVLGTVRSAESTEVLSLDAGETRCEIVPSVVPAQNGFYERHGAAYDLDCAKRWAVEVASDAKVFFVDSGIVTVEPQGAEQTEIRLLS